MREDKKQDRKPVITLCLNSIAFNIKSQDNHFQSCNFQQNEVFTSITRILALKTSILASSKIKSDIVSPVKAISGFAQYM